MCRWSVQIFHKCNIKNMSNNLKSKLQKNNRPERFHRRLGVALWDEREKQRSKGRRAREGDRKRKIQFASYLWHLSEFCMWLMGHLLSFLSVSFCFVAQTRCWKKEGTIPEGKAFVYRSNHGAFTTGTQVLFVHLNHSCFNLT